MSSVDSKSKYTLFIMIGLGILVCVIGIALYMMWRKMSATDIKLATVSKTSDDLRVSVAKLEQDIKYKNERVQELQNEISALKAENVKLSYKVKSLKREMPGKTCEDGTCTTKIEPIM
jgi:peptidoglycan hydrolase CwlO-like protein